MNTFFKADFYRMTGIHWGFNLRCFVKVIFSHQIRFMFWWRQTTKILLPLKKIMLYRYSRKYGLEISSDAKIGEGLYIGHPYNITIAGGVVLGRNVNLHKGCTIGRQNRGRKAGCPQIGNDVFIGINSTVVGDVMIGNDVIIAPNAYVNFDVPEHSVVIGNPGTIHKKDNATLSYVNYRV